MIINQLKNIIFVFCFVSLPILSQQALTNNLCYQAKVNMTAQNALVECLKYLPQADSINDILKTYINLADIYRDIGNSEQQERYLSLVKEHPKFFDNTNIVYLWNRKVGQKYYHQGVYTSASKHFNQGLSIALKSNNQIWISQSYNDVGLVEYQRNHYQQSLTHYQKSLSLKRQFGDLFKIGTTLGNIALVNLKLEEFEIAIQYYQEALAVYLKYAHLNNFNQKSVKRISHLYEGIAVAYTALGDVDKASYYADEVLKTFALKLSPRERSRALINLAKLHTEKSEFVMAKAFLEKAESLQENNLSTHQVDIAYELALLFKKMALVDESIKQAKLGLSLFETIKSDQRKAKLHRLLGELYGKTDQTKALAHMNQYQELRETFLKEKYNADLTTIQHQLEKQTIEWKLVNERLENAKNKQKVQWLTQWFLIAIILLISSISFITFFSLKKKREREKLLASIYYHKQQLILLNSSVLGEDKEHTEHLSDDDKKQVFKQQLVKTMIEALDIWEKHTGTNRLELAEKSKIWTISNDNGTLRTRALDRYLSINQIPKNPRWRNVVKTCHFILADPQLSTNNRTLLNQALDELMIQIKSFSLAANNTKVV